MCWVRGRASECSRSGRPLCWSSRRYCCDAGTLDLCSPPRVFAGSAGTRGVALPGSVHLPSTTAKDPLATLVVSGDREGVNGMAQSNGQAVLITSAFSSVRTENAESSARSEFDLKNFEKLPARDVPVNALSPGVALRQGGTDAAHIQLLVDAAGSAELPPILVQLDGCRIIDGLHRLEAARLRGDDTIKARFLDCSDSEALVIAMKANGAHGLPLSKADRVSGAQRVLCSHPDWSDRAIAGITGLSAKTIAALRARSADAAPLDGKRIGRDGRRR